MGKEIALLLKEPFRKYSVGHLLGNKYQLEFSIAQSINCIELNRVGMVISSFDFFNRSVEMLLSLRKSLFEIPFLLIINEEVTDIKSMEKEFILCRTIDEIEHVLDSKKTLFATKANVLNRDSLLQNLSKHERNVLILITQGLSSFEIGEKLFRSKRTIDGTRIKIMKKLGVSCKVSLIRKIYQDCDWVSLEEEGIRN